MPANYNGNSMVGRLRRVMVCSPRAAGWDTPGQTRDWKELGFHHVPDFNLAQAQHNEIVRILKGAGAEVIELPGSPDLSLDAVYAHDASFITDFGLIALNPGKANRVIESKVHKKFFHDLGIPSLGEIKAPGMVESGDVVWLDPTSLLIGNGYRTNGAGIFQMRALLSDADTKVVAAPLPYGGGPEICLHLMSLLSMLDEQTILVDLPWLAVETVEMLKARHLKFIEIDYSERDSLACNVLSLGAGRLVALKENERTNERLRAAGFEVMTFSGSELCINGGGGPTCLTRPILRD
jgi:N-dimethylarginine dimethylaminohydrolase